MHSIKEFFTKKKELLTSQSEKTGAIVPFYFISQNGKVPTIPNAQKDSNIQFGFEIKEEFAFERRDFDINQRNIKTRGREMTGKLFEISECNFKRGLIVLA